MRDVPAIALLLAALVLPVVLFRVVASRARFGVSFAAAIAVVLGWILNVAWASVAGESVAIAARFGWVCPTVLVLLAWGGMRLAKRRRA